MIEKIKRFFQLFGVKIIAFAILPIYIIGRSYHTKKKLKKKEKFHKN